ncbi:MAG TPA: hypothetical protein VLK34_02480, partial [Nocardioidaceae bacterium]|nr:hypothetical protein [Nocardioidaceae bacterium]
MTDPYAFYLPEDPEYTVVDSALDSVRFLLHVSERDANGHLMCRSIDAMSDGSQPAYRGRMIDGVGYCADSVFATQVLVRLGRAIGRPELERAGFSYLEHALETGFFDQSGHPVVMYRDVESGAFLLNLEARPEYIDVGHVAKVASELLRVAPLDTDGERAARCRDIAVRTVDWILSVERTANGWFPRKCSPDGRVYPFAAEALDPVDLGLVEQRPDPIHDRSGAGTLAV